MNKRYNSIIHGYTKSAPKRVKAKQAKQLARQTSLPLGGRSVRGLVEDQRLLETLDWNEARAPDLRVVVSGQRPTLGKVGQPINSGLHRAIESHREIYARRLALIGRLLVDVGVGSSQNFDGRHSAAFVRCNSRNFARF